MDINGLASKLRLPAQKSLSLVDIIKMKRMVLKVKNNYQYFLNQWLFRTATLVLLMSLLIPSPVQPVYGATQDLAIPPGHSDRLLQLKFVEGTDTNDLSLLLPPEIRQITQKVDPLFTLPKSLLKALKDKGNERLKKDKGDDTPLLPDLGLWYKVLLVQGTDLETAKAMFSALPSVEKVGLVALMPQLPSTGDYTSLQGYLSSATAGLDAAFAWTQIFGAGEGITIYDVEYGWFQDHEDLSKASLSPLLLNSGDSALYTQNDQHHGTAVLGELIADNNGFGVTGIAYSANIKLAPANTAQLGWNPANAILLSAADGLPGDVILVEQQTYVCDLPEGQNLGPSEYDLPVFQAIQTATALGMVVIEAAGNGGVNLDQSACQSNFDRNFRDSGAILVGAGGPPTSNYDREREIHATWASSFGSRVDVQGWGSAVMTTGYGNYPDPNAWLDPQEMYTNTFSGTSSAAPMVAASAAIIQSMALWYNNAPLLPWQVRDLLASTGSPQLGDTSENIGPRPDLQAALANLQQSSERLSVNVGGSQNDHLCGATDCSLSEAIEAANSNDAETVINLAFGETYTLTTVNASDPSYGAIGLPIITSPVTIVGAGATIERSSAVGTPEFRLVEVASDGNLNLQEVTLRNGMLNGKPGGALLNLGTSAIYSSTITGNSSANGGALNNLGLLTLINSTLVNNYASASGGSLWSSGSLVLTGVTMAGNNAPDASLVTNGTAMIRNTLMVRGTSGSNCSGIPGTGSISNMADDSSCGSSTAVKTSGQINLGTLTSNGGRTQTIPLLTGSTAIDMGNATACLFSKTRSPDQRNYNRFADGNGNGLKECDIGAYEYNSMELLPTAPPPELPPPQTQVTLNPESPDGFNGWYQTAPQVSVEVSDLYGVIEVRSSLDPAIPPTAYTDLPETACPFIGGATVSLEGFHTLYAAAMNINGKTNLPVSESFKLDSTPPLITCPVAGPFLLNSGDQAIGPADVDASVSGLDGELSILSGVIDTASIGLKPLTFIAFDLAGNSASKECSYPVIYDFDGFFSPLEPAPVLNPANAGSAIPIKFSLAGDQGLDVFAVGSPTSQKVDCQTLAPIGDSLAAKSAGKSKPSYDPLTGWYNTSWMTEKEWAATCRAITLKFVDGNQYSAYFNFR